MIWGSSGICLQVVGLLAGRQFLLLKVLGAHWLDNKIDVYCVRGAVTEQRKTFETCNLA